MKNFGVNSRLKHLLATGIYRFTGSDGTRVTIVDPKKLADATRGITKFEKGLSHLSNVKHPDHVKGWNGSLEELAKAVGRMRYDQVSKFVELLAADIHQQANNDWSHDRRQLAARLNLVSSDLSVSAIGLKMAWDICEPYMKEDKKNG